jgi:hypothetical protein
MFRVLAKKMEKVRSALLLFLKSETTTPQQLAAIAGKLISLSPAVLPAPIYSRTLFQAIQGKLSWDDIFPAPEMVTSTVKEWLDNLPNWNGRRWYAQPISLVVFSNALDFGYGGLVTLPNGEQVSVTGILMEEEVGMSSTAREVIGFLKLLEATAQLYPKTIKDSTVQLVGDNQAVVLAINQFRSRALEITNALKSIFSLCVAFGFNVSAIWKPRDMLEAEDMLSRQPDPLDWGIRPAAFQDICAKFRVGVTIDLFGSDAWHVVPRFVSLLYTPGCEACQALLIHWRLLIKKGDFAWLFPPVRIIPDVVQLIERYEVNCILVVPEQKASNWWVRLVSLPLARKIEQIIIPRGTDTCRPSRRVPAGTANPGLFKLRAHCIEW